MRNHGFCDAVYLIVVSWQAAVNVEKNMCRTGTPLDFAVGAAAAFFLGCRGSAKQARGRAIRVPAGVHVGELVAVVSFQALVDASQEAEVL